VGRVWREVEGTLAELPTERADEDGVVTDSDDELSIRRRTRVIS